MRIIVLFYHCEFNDIEILQILQQKEFFINRFVLVRIRKELKIIKRMFVRNATETNRKMLKIVKLKFDENQIKNYDKRLFYSHICSQKHIIFKFVIVFLIEYYYMFC